MRSGLVNVVNPVTEQQVTVRTPAHKRGAGRIVGGEVVDGNFDGTPGGEVAVVFAFQGVAVVFAVTGDENLPLVFGDDEIHPRLGRFAEDFKFGTFFDVGAQNGGVAAVRDVKNIVETAQQTAAGAQDFMREDAEHFFGERAFGNAVIVPQGGLRAPADEHGGIDVGFGPVEDLG